MFQKLLPAGRFLILIAVAGTMAATIALLVYGIVQAAQLIVGAFGAGMVSAKGLKGLALGFIEVVDLFLLGTVFYIVALGLYELFIGEIAVPRWLVITSLDDLKSKLVSVVIVILAILFLGQVVSWDGERNLLPYGGSIALVIAALTYFLSQKANKSP
ncbi:YqhA family protein [Gloeobacter kilaueensis]|uniref:YqhA family protein n=1 Tax=Gloeobacter kilaueensis (strain ATCC BAA-2537 / CCAP 1431/1 / ULC 316 / JS1) TaxID=1183438 RepID=U5QFH3_GLOK1|nr:YqhA family protein [Gloeobacter kilaueensis]AGY57633.1 hypothetical protein GKIL_1387 [Gloeobacter kilaueensis JS1]